MESPGSPYASSSPEVPMRSPKPGSPDQDDKEKTTYLRFLASNMAAGCIIGKGGSTISEFQSQSGARIQLSRNHEFFPGTSDRIILITGAFDDVIKAMEFILAKLMTETEESPEMENRSKVRLVVPNSCCGGIIGKGGSTIKSFIEDSQAGIKISPQDNSYVGLSDRIVTLSGSPKEQMRAIDLILSKLIEDSHYSQFVNTPYPYGTYNTMNYGSNGIGGRFSNNKSGLAKPSTGTQDGQGNSVTIGVADEHIGAVVGRGGRNIMEISQISGARIKISDRGDFMTGTSDRKVTITGSQEAIRAAESLIMDKISLNSER